MNNKKKHAEEINPQMAVVRSALDDLKILDEHFNTVLATKKRKKNTDDTDEFDIEKTVENLRVRQQALIQVLRRDNYYRNMNVSYLDTLFSIVDMCEQALEENEHEEARTLVKIWEKATYKLLKECYPNYMKKWEKLLESVSRMKILMAEGRRTVRAGDYDIESSLQALNT